MNQLYAEAGVKRKDTSSTLGLRFLFIFLIVNGFILTLLGGFFTVIGLALSLALIYLYPRLTVEYEYIYVDGQLDFDRISGKAKRKTILRIDMEQVDVVAPMGSHSLDAYSNVEIEKKDFSSRDKSKKPYIIISSAGSRKVQIKFEPNEKMINLMKQKSPRKVSTY